MFLGLRPTHTVLHKANAYRLLTNGNLPDLPLLLKKTAPTSPVITALFLIGTQMADEKACMTSARAVPTTGVFMICTDLFGNGRKISTVACFLPEMPMRKCSAAVLLSDRATHPTMLPSSGTVSEPVCNPNMSCTT